MKQRIEVDYRKSFYSVDKAVAFAKALAAAEGRSVSLYLPKEHRTIWVSGPATA
jgi:hypothetical protein